MKLIDVFLAILVPTIFGAGIVFAKAALEHFPPILLMALRFSCSALILFWFFRPPWHLMRRIFWIALVGATIQYSFTYTGLRDIDASLMVIVVQLEAPFAVILAWYVFGERFGWRKFCGMALAVSAWSLSPGRRTNAPI